MKRKWTIYLFLGVMILLILSQINYGYIRSKIIGMPYGIKLVDRHKLDIPEIPYNWERFPKDNKLSATQIWLNLDSKIPRHYAKIVSVEDAMKYSHSFNSFRTLNFETDRYIIDVDSTNQTDLVIRIDYDNLRKKRDYKSYEIVKINKLDTNTYIVDWFKENEVVKTLKPDEAIALLKEKGLK